MQNVNFFSTVLTKALHVTALTAFGLMLSPNPPQARAMDCSAATSTQLEMNRCALEESQKAEADLKRVYANLKKKVSPEGKIFLKNAQKLWNAYREKQCAFNTLGTAGGSAHTVAVAYCRTALARQQEKLLRAQLDCSEGNLSCGNQ